MFKPTKKTFQNSYRKNSLSKKLFVNISVLALFGFFHLKTCAQFSIDTQFRNRFEFRDGYKKLATETSNPAVFISQRTRISFVFENDYLKLKFTPQDVRVWGDEDLSSSTGVYGNSASLDLFEGYVQLKTGLNSYLSVGRQQLKYDNQRLLAARNWNQNGLAYDAIVYKWNPEKWEINIGSSWNSAGENSSDNFYPKERIKTLSFAWARHNFSDNWNLSLSHISSGVTRSDYENELFFRQTTGVYSTYNKDGLNLSGNLYYQFGKNQLGKKVSALLADMEIIYRIQDFSSGIGISYLSGNKKTGEEQQIDHLFDVLYGARHSFFGAIDYFSNFKSHTGEGGLTDYYFVLNLKLNKTSFNNTSHYFQLAQTNINTTNNKNLGFENDIAVKHSFSDWCTLECGYMFFIPTKSLKFIQKINDNKFSQFLFVQLTVTPNFFSCLNSEE